MNGRDTNGQFATGNSYGKGRPPRDAELIYLSKLTEQCSEDRWSKIVERAVTDAENGNPKAREWLASYLIGRPMHRLDIAFEEANLKRPEEMTSAERKAGILNFFEKLICCMDSEELEIALTSVQSAREQKANT